MVRPVVLLATSFVEERLWSFQMTSVGRSGGPDAETGVEWLLMRQIVEQDDVRIIVSVWALSRKEGLPLSEGEDPFPQRRKSGI